MTTLRYVQIHAKLASLLLVALMLAAATPVAAAPKLTCNGIPATIVGRPRGAVIEGTEGPDVIVGRGGDDMIIGRGGDDVICAGEGDDQIIWSVSDGSDWISGGPGQDNLVAAGGRQSDRFELSERGPNLGIASNGEALEVADTEVARIAPHGGADELIVNDLIVTALRQIELDLAIAFGGGNGDQTEDRVVIHASDFSEGIDLRREGLRLTISGLPTRMAVLAFDSALDQVRIEGKGGDDRISAGELFGLQPVLTFVGGEGNDVLTGSPAADTLLGDAGDDTLMGGAGNDLLDGGDDTDTLDGGPGEDVLLNSETVLDE